MISLHRLFEVDPATLKQAAIWGIGSLMASKLTQDKSKNMLEKKKNLKKALTQGLIGAAAGAAGSMV